LVEIADELYGLVPGEFVAARDAAAKGAREDGDRELADQVKALRKPSVGAWLADKLVRDQPAELDELLDLGQSMREARDALDGERLRSMSRQRHPIVRALIDRAAALAEAGGQRAPDAARRELETTLDATLADDQAADAFRTGRLVRGLTSTGLEPVDVTEAVAVPEATAPARRAKSRTGRAPDTPPKKSAGRGATKQSQQTKQQAKQQAARDRAVTDAEAAVDAAEKDRTQREDDLRSAQAVLDEARERVTELERELRAANTERARAETACREADAAHRAATRERDTARRALDAARRRAAD
jgi:hypothetical protein